MKILLLLSIRIYFLSLTSWLLSKLNSEFGPQLLKEAFSTGKDALFPISMPQEQLRKFPMEHALQTMRPGILQALLPSPNII